jgi:hypothetical protein
MSLALIHMFLGGMLKKLGNLNVWQLLCIALALFGAVQTIRVKTEQRHARKVEAQLSKATDLINRLREESKKNQAEVGKVVDRYVTVTKPEVRERVRVIESAPLPGGCRSPKEVLDADV